MSFDLIHEIFTGDVKEAYKFFPQKILAEISTIVQISAKIWFFELSKKSKNGRQSTKIYSNR